MYSAQFAKLWHRLTKDIDARMEALLAPSLTAGQLHVLELIAASDRMKPSDFAQLLNTSAAAVTTLFDRMEKSGLIERQRDEQDRRIAWVVMTDTGESELKRGVKLREELIESYLGKLSAHNQQVLLFLLGKVAN